MSRASQICQKNDDFILKAIWQENNDEVLSVLYRMKEEDSNGEE